MPPPSHCCRFPLVCIGLVCLGLHSPVGTGRLAVRTCAFRTVSRPCYVSLLVMMSLSNRCRWTPHALGCGCTRRALRGTPAAPTAAAVGYAGGPRPTRRRGARRQDGGEAPHRGRGLQVVRTVVHKKAGPVRVLVATRLGPSAVSTWCDARVALAGERNLLWLYECAKAAFARCYLFVFACAPPRDCLRYPCGTAVPAV